MSVEKLWVEGTVIEFASDEPCSRATIRSVGLRQVVIADLKDGTPHRLDKDFLNELRSKSEVSILSEKRDFGELVFSDISDSEQEQTVRRYKYVKALIDRNITKITKKSAGGVIAEIAEQLEEKPPHYNSVRTWYRSFMDEGGRIKGLYPKARYRGNRLPRIPAKTIEIIEKYARRYLTGSQPRVGSVVENVQATIEQYNLSVNDDPKKVIPVPSYQAIRRRALNCSYADKKKGRSGARAFQAELAGRDSPVTTSRILERVEVDHTQLDIHLVDDKTKTLLGRPYMTVLMDHHSEMVHGLQLSFVHPSFDALSIAMMNSFLPKDDFLNEIGCEGEWPAYGVPELLVVDNGMEFWSKNFATVGNELGFLVQFCPIRKAEYKGCVENFFNIVNFQVLDDLPGVVRKKGKCADNYDATKNATMTFSEFKLYLLNWITKQYHVKISATKGYSRLERWEKSVEENVPIHVESKEDLWPKLMCACTKKLSGSGIVLFCKNYTSPALSDLYKRVGSIDVTVKYNPFDIGYILVLDEENKIYNVVLCTKYEDVKGMSKYEDKVLRAKLKTRQKDQEGDIGLRQARVEALKAREEAHARNSRNKNQRTTAKGARVDLVGVPDLQLVGNNVEPLEIDRDEIEFDDVDDIEGWS